LDRVSTFPHQAGNDGIVGCNAETYWFASLFGDELAFRAEHVELDFADMPALLDLVRRSIRRAASGGLTQR